MDLQQKIADYKAYATVVSQMGRWERRKRAVHHRLLCEARWRSIFIRTLLRSSN